MIKTFLDKASAAYYAGSPLISDEEFDALAAQHKYEELGAHAPGGLPHAYPMWSLQKFYPGDELPKYQDPIVTPKLDGAAICLIYAQGVLTAAHTRGDGKRGQDVLDNIRHLVPREINTLSPLVQIHAEVAAPKSIPNARNYASGAIQLKDPAEVRTRDLTVIAYDVLGIDLRYYTCTLEWLLIRKFTTVVDGRDNEFCVFPTDGQVVRENDNRLFESMGYTSKHPRGAYALKPEPTLVRTKLLDVEWQLGRTGVVSPVGILEPVLVGEAMVSRATLHNMEYIEALGLELGCEVEIVRAGEIIPRIVRKV